MSSSPLPHTALAMIILSASVRPLLHPNSPIEQRLSLAWRGSAHQVRVLCALCIVLIGLLDYETGIDARVFPLYYVPIALGALRLSLRSGLLLAAISTACWAFAAWMAPARWSGVLFGFNTFTQAVSFTLIALLVGRIKRQLDVERDLGRTDPLTGLHNRRSFNELGEVLLQGARRSQRRFTIAYLDLDHFKRLNDTQGHQAGDEALRCVADVLRAQTRSSDVVARLGGDEFVLFLTDTEGTSGERTLERLSAAIAQEMSARGWPITASIGAVLFEASPASLGEALERADEVMYRAKQGGKNRVVCETLT